MKSSLQATLIAATAALAVALGAVAAHAGDQEDMLAAAQEQAAALDSATGGDNLVSNMMEASEFGDDDAAEAIDAMAGLMQALE